MSDFYLGERIMQLSVAEEHRQAELRRLQKEIRAGRTSWLSRQRYRSFSWLGSTLVSWGLQLLQSIAPLHPGAEGQANGKA